jgi:uncharacterized protein (TIGR02588 family)
MANETGNGMNENRNRDRDSRGNKADKRERIATTSPVELAVGAVGALLFLVMLAYLGFMAATTSEGPPRPVITAKPPIAAKAGHIVDYVVTNEGETAAAQVIVTGQLLDGERLVEERHGLVDYVPQASEQEGSLIFQQDPARHRLVVSVSSFTLP